jgi:hypothetical protein
MSNLEQQKKYHFREYMPINLTEPGSKEAKLGAIPPADQVPRIQQVAAKAEENNRIIIP